MSFDLGVFYTEKPHADDDAQDRYAAYCEEDDLAPWLEPSPKVAAFLKNLTAAYPDIDDLPERALDECPWAAGLDVSEGHVLTPIVFSRAEQMYPVIIGLAEKHGLVCFDPQKGRIVTAPPGIHVKETDGPPVIIPDDPKNPAKPLADTLKDLLKPLGFERKGRYWRKDAAKAVIALEAYNNGGNYTLWFYAWFKEIGKIDPAKVKSGGEYHLCRELVSNFIPERNVFRLLRAFHFGADYSDSILRLYGPELVDQLLSHYEPYEPLTVEWRTKELRQVMTEFVLPFFARIEAGEHEAIFAEQAAKEKQEEIEAREEEIVALRRFVARCKEWQAEGIAETELFARARCDLGMINFAALALSIAMGWTLDETREKMEANGIKWTRLTRELVDETNEEQGGLVKRADGRIEFLSS